MLRPLRIGDIVARMSEKSPPPSLNTHLHLARLDAALDALARGLVRLLTDLDSPPTSLDPPADADLSVPVGERPLSVTHAGTGTCGRSA